MVDSKLNISYNRIKPLLSTHLWILGNVLVGRGHDYHISPSELSTRLSRYIAAMSFKKIAHRFNNRGLSRRYIECLKQVKEIPIMSQPRKDRSGHYHRYQIETSSDRLFLEDFVKLSNIDHDLIQTQIPNMLKLANNLPSKDKDFELYTDETSAEFHNLLLELLDCFKNALDALMAFDKDNAAREPDCHGIFKKNVHHVHVYGYALLRLYRGRAFQVHLENIQTLLVDFCRLKEIDEHERDGKRHEEDFDEELRSIQSFPSVEGSVDAGKSLLKSYTID